MPLLLCRQVFPNASRAQNTTTSNPSRAMLAAQRRARAAPASTPTPGGNGAVPGTVSTTTAGGIATGTTAGS